MAKIGLKNLRYAVITDVATDTYGTPASAGKAVSVSVAPNLADAKLYADDALTESDSTFISAVVTAVVDDDRMDVLADLLGRTPDETTGEVVRKSDDVAPYVGLGRVITKIVNGARVYKAEFLCKVKFKEPSQENNTKADTVEFGTVSIEGDASTLSDGLTWSKTNEFETLAEANTYLDTCFGVTP